MKPQIYKPAPGEKVLRHAACMQGEKQVDILLVEHVTEPVAFVQIVSGKWSGLQQGDAAVQSFSACLSGVPGIVEFAI